MKRILIVFIFLAFVTNLISQQNSDVFVHSLIMEELAVTDSVSCMLVLKEQVEKININRSDLKVQKTSKVFDVLSSSVDSTQKRLLDSLTAWNVPHHSFYIVNAIQATLDIRTLHSLQEMEELHSILPDFPITTPPEKIIPGDIRGVDTLLNWGIGRIRADSAWHMGYTGHDVVVAGLDTGVKWGHDFLRNSYRGYMKNADVDHDYNWHDAIHKINSLNLDTFINHTDNPCGLDAPVPCDDNGHGTFTMGIMTGKADNQYSGIAPGAKWIGCRVMERGAGVLSTYLSGLEWCLAPTRVNGKDPRPELAPDIITNSWACPRNEGCIPENYWILDSAVSRLNDAGILVVASAGNEGQQGCSSLINPLAIFSPVFTVGATDRNDSIAGFSSRGPVSLKDLIKPDAVAPGTGVTSIALHGGFQKSSGTSISAPIVAGVAALILEANPDLRGHPEIIRNLLTDSAIPLPDHPCGTSQSPNPVYGYGRIDALRAVQMALQYEPTPADNNLPDNAFELYPNPFIDHLNVGILSDHRADVDIIDIQGRVVARFSVPCRGFHKFQTTHFNSGVYFARIMTKEGFLIRKLIKF